MFAAFDDAAEEIRTHHLPSAIEDGIRYYRALIEKHHDAVLTLNLPEARQLNADAHDLAVKLNQGRADIMGHRDAPTYMLERGTEAPKDSVPLWGQTGNFIVEPQPKLLVRIQMDGMFGIGADPIPGFSAHVVHPDKKFISPTGYRSFLGLNLSTPEITIDVFVCEIIRAHIRVQLKGRLHFLDDKYRKWFT